MSVESPSKTLLVPLDGSEFAEAALAPATAIAGATGDVLHLMSVPEVYGIDLAWYAEATTPGSVAEAPIAELMAEAKQESLAYLGRTAGRLAAAGLAVGSQIDEREPAEAILAVAEEVDAWLVVMATHGQGGVTRWAFGSVADQVLHRAQRPILLVRSGSPTGGLEHIMVALDGSPRAEAVLPDTTRLAQALKARLTLVHVVAQPRPGNLGARFIEARRKHGEAMEAYLRSLAQSLADAGVDASVALLESGSPAKALLDWEAAEGVSLVAMTTHGRSGLRRTALGSVADRLIREGSAPVLLKRVS